MHFDLPMYGELPVNETTGQRTAWGLFDHDGARDEIGTLNLLTPERALNASQEIRTGKSVSLNWGLEKIHNPGFGRTSLKHKFVDWREKEGFDFYSYDDEITVNTQAGSQWDGLSEFRLDLLKDLHLSGKGHWGHSQTGFYYNGIHHEDLLKGTHLGIDHWDRHGGIVGRGVLLDYCSWAQDKSISYDPMSQHAIRLPELLAMAKEYGIEFQRGDILLVRTGWVKWYEEHDTDSRVRCVTRGKAWVGVEGSLEVLEWLWNQHFAAVAGDSIGWEVWPPEGEYKLHDHLLALWGMPIGEMWDLEALATECKRQKRWTFFLTSSPLNTTGGVASPPNALAIF